MTGERKLQAAVLVTAALSGLVAMYIASLGPSGPLIGFGSGDAQRAADGAWIQLPLHLLVGIGFAMPGPMLLRLVAWFAALVGFILLAFWALLVLESGIGAFWRGAGVAGLVQIGTLVLLYVVLFRAAIGRSPPPAAAPA